MLVLPGNLNAITLAPVAAETTSGGMSSILQFILLLAIIIAAAKVSGFLSVKVGMPAVLGELLTGVVLGPTLLNLFGLPFVTDASLFEGFQHLAEIGVIFLMFMAGLETNLEALKKVGKVAGLAGVMGVIVPLILGTAGSLPFGFPFEEALFIGLILTATSVSISAQTLLELGVLKRKEGLALMAAAVIDDVLVIIVLSLFLALTSGGGDLLGIGLVLVKMVFYFLVAGLIGWKVLPWLLRQAQKLPISEGLTALTVVVLLLYAWSAEYLGGVAMITGAFVVGVAVARTSLKSEIEAKFHILTYGLFVPIFFVSIGLAANLAALAPTDFLLAAVIIVAAVLGKIIGCGFGARLGGFDNKLSFRLGLGMISRGEVGLIVASVGLSQGLIGQNVYGVMVLMVLVTTLITPPILKLVYRNENSVGATSPEMASQPMEGIVARIEAAGFTGIKGQRYTSAMKRSGSQEYHYTRSAGPSELPSKKMEE